MHGWKGKFDFMKTMMEFLRSRVFWSGMAIADAGLWLAGKFSLWNQEETKEETKALPALPALPGLPAYQGPVKGFVTADDHKAMVGKTHAELLGLPAMPVETGETHAVLVGGSLDGAVVEIEEGVRMVALMLVRNEATGFVESYERHDGRFLKRDGKLVGVYRWQLTVGRKGFGSPLTSDS